MQRFCHPVTKDVRGRKEQVSKLKASPKMSQRFKMDICIYLQLSIIYSLKQKSLESIICYIRNNKLSLSDKEQCHFVH